MKTLVKSAITAALLLSGSGLALAQSRAAAQPVSGPVVPGMAVWSVNAVVSNSNAFRVAQQQTPVTYKATIDAIQTRGTQLNTQLQAKFDKFNRDRQAPNANTPAAQASLQAQGQDIQNFQQSAEQDIAKMREPLELSNAYVLEQINDKLADAVKQAMAKKNISILIPQQNGLVAGPGYSLTQQVVDELNILLPAAQLVPPAGWEPREVREQKAAQAAQQAAQTGRPAAPAVPAAPGAPARPSTDGR